jgi:hypothetical protein
MRPVFTNIQVHSHNSRHTAIFERAVTALVPQKKTTGISNKSFCTAFVVGEQVELGWVLCKPPRTIRLVAKSLNEIHVYDTQKNVHTSYLKKTHSAVLRKMYGMPVSVVTTEPRHWGVSNRCCTISGNVAGNTWTTYNQGISDRRIRDRERENKDWQ